MKILILGGEGMLGHKVYEVLSKRFDTYAAFSDFGGLWSKFPMYSENMNKTIAGINVMDFGNVIRAVSIVKPDVVVNCIGIIKQLKEANDPIISIYLNSLFPHKLAELCDVAGARMFHMSTDCVFTGKKGNYTEEDISDAEDLYGRSKFMGEVTQRKNCLTIRTSIFGRDFLKQSAMLEWFLSNRGGKVKGYKNAMYTGFPTQCLAQIMGDILEKHQDLWGLYHITASPISKCDLLTKIRDRMNLNIEIEPFDDPPCDRSMSAAKFLKATNYKIPTWDEMVEILANDKIPYDEWRLKYAKTA